MIHRICSYLEEKCFLHDSSDIYCSKLYRDSSISILFIFSNLKIPTLVLIEIQLTTKLKETNRGRAFE